MKKIFLFLISLILTFSFGFGVYANLDENAKYKLEREENGILYIKKIDEIVAKMSKEDLQKFSNILEKKLKTYNGKYINLLNYLKYKIDFTLKNQENEVEFEKYVNKDFGFEILREKDKGFIPFLNFISFFEPYKKDKDFIVSVFNYSNFGPYVKKFEDLFELDGVILEEGMEKLNINGKKVYHIYLENAYYYYFGNDETGIIYVISFNDKNYKYKEKVLNSFKMYENVNLDFIKEKVKDLEFKESKGLLGNLSQ